MFEIAEIPKFTREDRARYERSLKYYRDLKNVIDTTFDQGLAKGIIVGKSEGKVENPLEIARQMKLKGLDSALSRKSLVRI